MFDLVGISKPLVPSDKWIFTPSSVSAAAGVAVAALALGPGLPQLPLAAPGTFGVTTAGFALSSTVGCRPLDPISATPSLVERGGRTLG